MIYYLLYPLYKEMTFFNIFKYITFRTIYSGISAFLICILLGPSLIRIMRKLQIGQYIRECGPTSHFDKQGTPTMGGLLIIGATLFSIILWGDLNAFYIWITIIIAIGYTAIGFTDDYIKQIKKEGNGLSARNKFLLQISVSLIAGILIYLTPGFNTELHFPFFKNFTIDLGIWYIFFAAFVISASSNAVNLTDGLDGLAIGPVIIAAGTYLLFSYVAGHAKLAQYLQITYAQGCAELTVLCGAIAGAGLGFLWFNSYPAQIFMGDTGSLPLGGLLGTIAVLTKQEILLVIIGGIFVMEALSVIIQVSYFKISKGKRFFRMSPIHHHFEMKKWPEPKIIVRFWIISIIFALIAISTLKIR
ncbi:MAG: phospho-N-acetylmuramoyl-pentapeptide-transferase [Deltaproteobacteria bacterium]|nr:MAG: phospho-N-acetylmuramoyl-pentapeptide-transferase [Deltaproteobacteria bacterium]